MSRQIRWLTTVLIAPMLAFAVAGSSYVALRCSLTGMAMVEPCCATAVDRAEGEQPAAHDSIAERSCCEWLVVSTEKIPATFSKGEQAPVRVELFVVAWTWPLPSRPLGDPSVRSSCENFSRAAWPSYIGSSSFLLKHSFLI